jgi:ABC-2 type transport system permease protein
MGALGRSIWIELKLFLREPLTVVFTLALPLLFLFVLGGIFGNTPNPGSYRGAGPWTSICPATWPLCGWPWAAGPAGVPGPATGEGGVLGRLRASSAPPWMVLGAQLVAALVISLAGACW